VIELLNLKLFCSFIKRSYEKGKPYALAFPDESHEIGEKEKSAVGPRKKIL
jgi:hypothetical protein